MIFGSKLGVTKFIVLGGFGDIPIVEFEYVNWIFKKSSKPRPSRIVLNVFVVNSAWFWPAFIGNREDTSQNCKVRATVPSDKATDNGETPST
jgi:hypothetical protein